MMKKNDTMTYFSIQAILNAMVLKSIKDREHE